MIFRGEKLKFKRGDRLGKGGNGIVHEIICLPPSADRLVAKFLIYSNNNYKKKYARFKQEVQTVQRLSKSYDGLLPIIDCYLPEQTPNREETAWFVMPLATQLKNHIFGHHLNIKEKMNMAKDIGRILSHIHRKGYSHRDIKLDNLLVYRENVVLSDFGLVSHQDYDRLTGSKERVGPWNTIAPEMKREPHKIKDARPADVYSFAKLIWIILTEDEDCFEGQYSKEKVFGLKCDMFNVASIECIDRLLMQSTNDDPGMRPTIDRALDFIYQWEKVIIDENLLKKEKQIVAAETIRRTLTPKKSTFTEFNAIFDILGKIIECHTIKSQQFEKLLPKTCQLSRVSGCIELSDDRNNYILKPKEITMETGSDMDIYYVLELQDITDQEVAMIEEEVVRSEEVTLLDMLVSTMEFPVSKIVLHGEKDVIFESY
ncbi:protein kinase domain-containing protein [Sporosarcina sp. FSL K6-5500]|uniref:protein kinase domain-containing protein n=1 Tax=Sporosarcina sp. FSL K6-5500 TaxID=2921558 RepID=UPI0030F7C97C